MSKLEQLEQLEEQYNDERNGLLKEKTKLMDQLNQVKKDKIYYKQKANILEFNRVSNKEHDIEYNLQLIESKLIALKTKIDDLQREKDIIERKRKQEEKQKQTRKMMDDVLRYMEQGKNRSEAAEIVGIKESKILHWYKEGKDGTNKNTTYFYNELSKIEKEQKEKVRKERIKQLKQKKIKDKIKKDAINDLMTDVLIEMRNGNTREQAAQIAGVKLSQVNDWYEKGLNHENKDFHRFYNNVNEIEGTQKYSLTNNQSTLTNLDGNINKNFSIDDKLVDISLKSTSMIPVKYCQKCGKRLYDAESNYCSDCGCSLIEVKKNFDSKSKTTINTNSFGKCCSGLMVIFVIIAILMVII